MVAAPKSQQSKATPFDTSTRMLRLYIYMKDSINNLSFLFYYFLSYHSEKENLPLRKILLLAVSLLQFQIKKLQNISDLVP